MTDIEKLKKAVIDICKQRYGKETLRSVNNKRDYQEIAEKVGCHPTKSSSLLNKAAIFGLVKKEDKIWKKTPEFRHLNLNQTLREESIDGKNEKTIKVRKRKKTTNTDLVKQSISDYLINHYAEILHPFSSTKECLSENDLKKATSQLFRNLETDGPSSLENLSERFYESFSAYFSSDRIRKIEFINNFSNLVKCFEAYLKKVAVIKTGNADEAKSSLNKDIISKVISFSSNINKNQDAYWRDKPIHEACIRFVFPYRHKESHEARNYTLFQMEKVIYYFFASIIFINLDY